MNFVQISRASDNPKTAPKGRHNIGRGVSPCFVVHQQTKPGKGDTTQLYVPPRWGSNGIRLVRNKATFRLSISVLSAFSVVREKPAVKVSVILCRLCEKNLCMPNIRPSMPQCR